MLFRSSDPSAEPYEFNPKDWEDPYIRGRLTSGGGPDDRVFDYDVICAMFSAFCSHVVDLPSYWDRLLSTGAIGPQQAASLAAAAKLYRHTPKRQKSFTDLFSDDAERREWCARHCTGYWIDSNFTDEDTYNVFTSRYGFEKADDAILFKLTWG